MDGEITTAEINNETGTLSIVVEGCSIFDPRDNAIDAKAWAKAQQDAFDNRVLESIRRLRLHGRL